MNRHELARRRRHNIRVYVRRGLDSGEIAKLVGVSRDSVNRIRRQIGAPARNRTRFRRWSPALDPRVAEMTRLRAQGLSDGRIARRIGVDPSTVRDWRDRLGMPPGWQRQSGEDATQKETVRCLQRWGPLSAHEAASLLDVSLDAVRQRLLRLERLGLVQAAGWLKRRPGKGYRAKLWVA